MKLSIIIPVFNVEKYLEKCLKSCLNQDILSTDYEIIVVNDGSSDSSLVIADRIASNVTNIKVISQANKGLSAARNIGLENAKGRYVWFVDSDDWIENNCLVSLFPLMDGVDFIAISSKKIWNDHHECSYVKEVYTGKELLQKSLYQPVPFYIIKRDFLITNKLRFKEGIFHEDMEFTPRMVYFANKIHTTRDCIYNYLQREKSITSIPNSKRAFDLLKVADSLYRFRNENVSSEYKYLYNNIISLGINNAYSIISQNDEITKQKWMAELRCYKHIIKVLKESTKMKYKVQGYIFSMFPISWSVNIYKLMKSFK